MSAVINPNVRKVNVEEGSTSPRGDVTRPLHEPKSPDQPLDTYHGFGSAPAKMDASLETIKVGQVGGVQDFLGLGREIFGNDHYKGLNPKTLGNLRLQYALRSQGMELGRFGNGNWGGDGIRGKKTNQAIEKLREKLSAEAGWEHTPDQAIAWAMDQTNAKLGFGHGRPYFNPKTKKFDLNRPVWVQPEGKANPKNRKKKTLSRKEQVLNMDPIIQEYESRRRYGKNRKIVEGVWKNQIEPKLKANGRSEGYIRSVRAKFDQKAKTFIFATTKEKRVAGARKINVFRKNVEIHEARYAKLQRAWSKEIYPALKKGGASRAGILSARQYFFGELVGEPFLEAKNPEELNKAWAIFQQEKTLFINRYS